jgi:septal ring factor EnvC (AmiA/AmiB activator)
MIANWTVGWMKPPAEKTAAEAVASSKAPPVPAIDSTQVQQIAQSLAALRETVEQIAAGQDQTTRQIARLESAVADLILKIPEPPAQLPSTPARKPMPVPPSSRAPTAPQSSRTH